MPKIDIWSAQNILDSLLSIRMFTFKPKDLLLDQKNFEFKEEWKMVKEGLLTSVLATQQEEVGKWYLEIPRRVK